MGILLRYTVFIATGCCAGFYLFVAPRWLRAVGGTFEEARKEVRGGEGRKGGEGGGVLDRRNVFDLMHGRSRMTVDPRIPTMPGRSMLGFHRPGKHCLHHARRKGREVSLGAGMYV